MSPPLALIPVTLGPTARAGHGGGWPVPGVLPSRRTGCVRRLTDTGGSTDNFPCPWMVRPSRPRDLDREVEELRASRERLVLGADAESEAIERKLHDGVQQQLVALAVNLQRTSTLVAADPAAAKTLLDQMASDVQTALDEAARLAERIHAPLSARRRSARGGAPLGGRERRCAGLGRGLAVSSRAVHRKSRGRCCCAGTRRSSTARAGRERRSPWVRKTTRWCSRSCRAQRSVSCATVSRRSAAGSSPSACPRA